MYIKDFCSSWMESLTPQPQDTIVRELELIESDKTTKDQIQTIIQTKFPNKTSFEIRKAIYGAYAIMHRDRKDFISDLIEKQNAFLESVVGIPFRLEFAHIKTLAYELGSLTLKEWEKKLHFAHMVINCTVLSLREHGFTRVYGLDAVNHWEQNHRSEELSSDLMHYLRAYVYGYMY
jgi:hypothetical protein